MIYSEKTVVFFKTFSLIHAHPSDGGGKAKKKKNELLIIWFCYKTKNYIIELFINFKIHFILKHLLLYPDEGYIYDI